MGNLGERELEAVAENEVGGANGSPQIFSIQAPKLRFSL